MRLLVLDTAQPEQFYLPKPSLARYAGFEAVVEGARLPLNADRLVEANVLDALFEAQHSGDVLGHGKVRGPRSVRDRAHMHPRQPEPPNSAALAAAVAVAAAAAAAAAR